MRKLSKPSCDLDDVYESCISTFDDADLIARLILSQPEILKASNEFDRKVLSGTLHTIAKRKDPIGRASADEMKKVYVQKMVPQDSPGRVYYDQIMSLAPGGICPLCAQRRVSTLDHHLPKAQYAALSVTPFNLVPACKDCNLTKKTNVPLASTDQTLHPYYDDIDHAIWLVAEIVPTKPIAVQFSAVPPGGWSKNLVDRITHHFASLELASLYTSHAAEEYCNVELQLATLFKKGGATELKAHLHECIKSRAVVHTNSWQIAFYRALLASAWFCDGKFI